MGALSRWAVFNPKKAVALWVLLMVVVFGAAGTLGANYNESFTLPDTESKQVEDLLKSEFDNVGSDATTVKVVFSPATGAVTAPAVKKQVDEVLAELKTIPSLTDVVSPFAPAEAGSSGGGDKGAANPAGTAGAFLAPISANERVAYATAEFKVNEDGVAELKDLDKFIEIVKASNTADLTVGASGATLEWAGAEEPKSELIGIGVALVILLLMFGAVVAAGLPIITALFGLATGMGIITIATQVTAIPEFITILAAMIGLGVGIDYSLFVINRFKTAIDAGREVRAAALETVNTAGRAVLFAATTVIIALAGLLVLGVDFLNGLAIGSILVVLSVMASASWLLPALLSWMGPKAFAWKLPGRKTVRHYPNGTPMARYGNWLQHRPWVGLIALALVVLVAIPMFSLRLGFADNSGRAEGTPLRVGYDLLGEGFGPGINGPFIVAAALPEKGDVEGANKLAEAIQQAPGVAGATNPFFNTPQDPAQATAALITVYPSSQPQDQATDDLLTFLRDDVVPAATADTGVKAYIGGAKAAAVDFGKVLSDALPLFLLIVIGLGFVALSVLFRSIVVPLTAAITSLLSFAAGVGAAVAVFQWGWLNSLLGVESTGPIAPFLPVMLFAILFGLSMDYQVFLVSRMREEWAHTLDNRRSVRRGLAGSGRVVVAAALIMASVFFAFVLADDQIGKLFGLALGTAVLIDAFLVRLVVVPALMTVLGPVNWWLPGWLDRLLPHLEVEQSASEFEAEDALIEDVPDAEDDQDLEPSVPR